MYRLREKIIDFYKFSLPTPYASLVAGMSVGSKELLSRDFWDKLKHTGTAHVVVASGMNVTLVASFLINLLINFMRRQKAIIVALTGIWIYTVLAGFDAPIVRAAIMGSIGFTAVIAGRLSNAWRALFVSVLIMLIVWPDWVSDLGFILSFVATGSLMLFEKKIRLLLKKIHIPKVIREDLSTSVAAQIGVAPILYFTFGNINILSPIINAFILWTVVPITIIGGLGGIIGLIVPGLGRMILLLSYPLTWWFVFVVQLFSK